MFAATEQNRCNRQVKLIDETGAEIFSNRGDAAAESDIFACGGFRSSLERGLNAVRHEMKSRPTLHHERFSGMVSKHENRAMVWRVIAPPAFPAVVGPSAPDRPKHVAPKNPGSDILETPGCKIIVDSCLASVPAEHLLKRARREEPFMEAAPPRTKWVFQTLVQAGAVTID